MDFSPPGIHGLACKNIDLAMELWRITAIFANMSNLSENRLVDTTSIAFIQHAMHMMQLSLDEFHCIPFLISIG